MIRNRFFIIGAQRSGSTYLYKALDEHPEICMAKPMWPEPKFFLINNQYSKGITYYEKQYFNNCFNVKTYGEKSTSYYEYKFVAKRIKDYYPNSKIIFILRNPIYRALSNYYFSVNNGLETRSLRNVFIERLPAPEIQKDISVSPFNYLERGIYLPFIKNYLNYFSRENIKVLIMEKTLGRITEIGKIYSFLDVDSSFNPSCIHEKINSNNIDLSQVEEDIVNKLKKYFYQYNKLLGDFLDINLDIWNI